MGRRKLKEGKLTEAIEDQTARMPSVVFLMAGLGALAASVALSCMKRKKTGLLIGQFASPFLIMGLYDKVVKQNGHD